jgi:hypothetical protein
MNNSYKVTKGLKLCTNKFTYSDCLFLVNILNQRYGLKCSIHSSGAPEQYVIYILKESFPILRTIVKPYFHPSMLYKIID